MTGGREPFLPAPGLPQAQGHEWTARPPTGPRGKGGEEKGRVTPPPPTPVPTGDPRVPHEQPRGKQETSRQEHGGTPPLLRGPLS